jgi:hypothetical protein
MYRRASANEVIIQECTTDIQNCTTYWKKFRGIFFFKKISRKFSNTDIIQECTADVNADINQ